LSRIRTYLEPVEIHPRKCSVNTIITDCLSLLSPETVARQVKCILDLAPRLPSAYVDPEVLGQTFINLVRNATEAMEEGGELFIKSFESDQELHIEFKNQFVGLKVKYPENLFMPFAEGGKSFGLPLCYRLLKDMDGLLSHIEDNDYIVFMVSLPKIVEPRSERMEL
jgi:signal transduction histidine kinase